jgi:hypothetical protein
LEEDADLHKMNPGKGGFYMIEKSKLCTTQHDTFECLTTPRFQRPRSCALM